MKQRREEERLDELTNRLYRKGEYVWIKRHVRWYAKGHCGEYDLLGKRRSGRLVYFEEKSHYNYHSRHRATEQFLRSYLYAPKGKQMLYVLVTPEIVERWSQRK